MRKRQSQKAGAVDGAGRAPYGLRMAKWFKTAGWRRAALGWALLNLAGCATAPVAQDPWFGQDKFKHFGISAVVAGVATVVGEHNGLEDGEAFAPAIGLTLALGAGKETYDARVKRTFWSWRDLTWGLMGGLAGYGLGQMAE